MSKYEEICICADIPKKSNAYFALKRAFDIAFSILAILVLLLPMGIVALLIKCQDGGSVFYKAKRIGYHGQPFKLLKFRSMKMGADKLENVLTAEQLEEYRREFKLENDPRLTKIGSFIRKTSIDEVPQFLNVLSGKMSVVGPRPIVKDELAQYGKQANLFLSAKPGLTGYWQAYARNNVGYANGKRQEMELYYVKNRTIWLDLKIIVATVGRVITRKGAK